jgi:hypothetical protein
VTRMGFYSQEEIDEAASVGLVLEDPWFAREPAPRPLVHSVKTSDILVYFGSFDQKRTGPGGWHDLGNGRAMHILAPSLSPEGCIRTPREEPCPYCLGELHGHYGHTPYGLGVCDLCGDCWHAYNFEPDNEGMEGF